jgi:hypothetical protein
MHVYELIFRLRINAPHEVPPDIRELANEAAAKAANEVVHSWSQQFHGPGVALEQQPSPLVQRQ